MVLLCTDPADGTKGQTWGPSTLQRDRHHRAPFLTNNGRWARSAPNLEKSLRHLGHSNIGALQELGQYVSLLMIVYKYS